MLLVFQSTLPRRERLEARGIVETKTNFNPRSREGSDRNSLLGFWRLLYFNPRSREGSDEVEKEEIDIDFVFQSTLPRRERPSLTVTFAVRPLFQSTLPRRERLELLTPLQRKYDFNPRSREGSDLIVSVNFPFFNYFNPRSREGSDLAFQFRFLLR